MCIFCGWCEIKTTKKMMSSINSLLQYTKETQKCVQMQTGNDFVNQTLGHIFSTFLTLLVARKGKNI